jgi:hypothetical protein
MKMQSKSEQDSDGNSNPVNVEFEIEIDVNVKTERKHAKKEIEDKSDDFGSSTVNFDNAQVSTPKPILMTNNVLTQPSQLVKPRPIRKTRHNLKN